METLVRLFVKDHENTSDPRVREDIGALASIVGIIANIFLAASKIVVGFLTSSMSIAADGFNNLMDSVASVVTLLGFKLSGREPDEEHPMGHGRFEYIAGFVVAIIVIVVGIELVRTGVERILDPQVVEYGWVALGLLVLAIIVKLWMAAYSRSLGEKIDSSALIAVAVDSRNDVLATAAVLAAALVARFTGWHLDGWATVGVALFILYSGVDLVRDTISSLLGQAPSKEVHDELMTRLQSGDEIMGVHDLIVHDYGPARTYASAHVEMPAHMDPVKAHDVIDGIERSILADLGIHMVIHHDPVELETSRPQ